MEQRNGRTADRCCSSRWPEARSGRLHRRGAAGQRAAGERRFLDLGAAARQLLGRGPGRPVPAARAATGSRWRRTPSRSCRPTATASCIGLSLGSDALRALARLADAALYAGRGRLSRHDARIALRLWREAPPPAARRRRSMPPCCARSCCTWPAVQRELAARIPRCPGRSRSRKRQVFGRLQRARLYLEGNCDRVVRISELAELTSFSSWYFSKTFHEPLRRKPAGRLARMRMERAADLLSGTSMMIGEVAAACGFDNCCSFARAFRARFGVSATRYRQGTLPRASRADSAKSLGGAPQSVGAHRNVSCQGVLTRQLTPSSGERQMNHRHTAMQRGLLPASIAIALAPAFAGAQDAPAAPLRRRMPPPSTASRSPVRAFARPTWKPRSRSSADPARTSRSRASPSVADILQNLTAAGSPAISRTAPLASGEAVGGQYIDLRNLGAHAP